MSCVFFAVTAGAQTVAGPNADLPSAVDLLKEAYLTGAQLVPANRCRLLLGLARAAVSISPPDAKAWAEESLTLAKEYPRVGSAPPSRKTRWKYWPTLSPQKRSIC